jgi:hypothetical protein
VPDYWGSPEEYAAQREILDAMEKRQKQEKAVRKEAKDSKKAAKQGAKPKPRHSSKGGPGKHKKK